MTSQTAEALYTQTTYRACLDVLSRPGTIAVLGEPEPAEEGLQFPSHLAGLGLSLLDQEVTFHLAGGTPADTERMQLHTMSRPAPLEACDYLFLEGPYALDPTVLKRGELQRPEDSCTVLCSIVRLSDEPPAEGSAIRLTLAGPGIRDTADLYLQGLAPGFLDGLAASNREFPLGIDCFFVDRDGRICGVPRSSRLRWEAAKGGA